MVVTRTSAPVVGIVAVVVVPVGSLETSVSVDSPCLESVDVEEATDCLVAPSLVRNEEVFKVEAATLEVVEKAADCLVAPSLVRK